MKSYLSKTERIAISQLLLSKDIESVKIGLSLLQNCPRYKYFKSKIIYRYQQLHFRSVKHNFEMYHTHAKKSIEDLIKDCYHRLNYGLIGGAVSLLVKSLFKYEKVF